MNDNPEFREFAAAVGEAKRGKRLHAWVEKRLFELLKRLYPDSCPVSEVAGILGGRNDLIQFFPNGRRVVFELFVTVSQVPQDLRLLEQSDADVKIAILLDKEIDSKLAREYFRKKPNHFPYVWLSEVLMPERESKCLNRLRELIESQVASQPGIPFPGTSDKLKRFTEQTSEIPVGVYQQLSILCRDFKNRLFNDSLRGKAENRLREWFDRHHLSLNREIRDEVRSILNEVGCFPGWRSRAEPEAADYQRKIIDLLRDIEAAADEHAGTSLEGPVRPSKAGIVVSHPRRH